jgi:cytochrome oxidase Cu insertion factor (SCO1/SenC/PrrC family)
VLRTHARSLGARLDTWTFLTGDRDAIDRFAARFGVSVTRAVTDPRDITHNLRTAVIDAEGRLVKVFTGYGWAPSDVLDEIRKVSGHRVVG